MRIFQIVSSVEYGDAVGNDIIALKKVIKEMGFETQTYAIAVSNKLSADEATDIKKLPDLHDDDVVLYHFATETYLNYEFAKYKCKKIMVYHNITPAKFFQGYDYNLANVLEKGQKGVAFLSDKVDYCFADSFFNKQELIDYGFKMPIDVLPILIPFADYKKDPSKDILEKYNDERHNIVFAGRVVPNKCQHDIIAAFACYKKYYDPEARLFLVGSYGKSDTYYRKLVSYIEQLEVNDVFLTGHISFDEILAYYKLADVFVCMSEHEGFCVPLIEAMLFEVPIIAYNSTAVPETLGDAGILVFDKKPIEVAALINRVIHDPALRETIRENQKEHLKKYQYNRIVEKFKKYLNDFLNAGKE